MQIRIPTTYEAIVDEIARFSTLERSEVQARLWNEAVQPGWNVNQDLRRFHITPHHHDAHMEHLYRESHAFIFETMAFWARPDRQTWIEQACARIERYAAQRGVAPAELSILVLGDGVGNDSLYMASRGWRVDYYDVPGSRTFAFAEARFVHFGVAGGAIRLTDDLAACKQGRYDVVLCFEVLEHLPDPNAAIAGIAEMLIEDGIALITEAFGYVNRSLPTHLRHNMRFDGLTPFLFLRHGLLLRWYSHDPEMKPMEFQRKSMNRFGSVWALLRQRMLMERLWRSQLRPSVVRLHLDGLRPMRQFANP